MAKKSVLNIKGALAFTLLLCVGVALSHKGFAHDPQKDLPANKIFGSFDKPTTDKPQAIGFYSKGCLSGAVKLEDTGPNWQIMRPGRNRNWGHSSTISFIKELSKNASEVGWKGLYIGDIGGPRGGPMPYGHQSHQIGLDVDIWLSPPKSLSLTKKQRDNLEPISIRKENLREINQNWTPDHAKILKAAATNDKVDRIFITAPAKIWMCENLEGQNNWLQKIRPIWGHHYHFHVRLKCPKGSSECIQQKPTVSQISNSSNGCDETLYWWVTKALEPPDPKKKKPKPKKKKGARDYKMIDLPKSCYEVIHMN